MTLERVVAARWIKLEKKKERTLYIHIVCDKKNNFFQVRTAGSGVRGWLDASHETNNWLKYVRSTSSPHAVNMRHVLIGGQVMFEKERKKKKKKLSSTFVSQRGYRHKLESGISPDFHFRAFDNCFTSRGIVTWRVARLVLTANEFGFERNWTLDRQLQLIGRNNYTVSGTVVVNSTCAVVNN